MKASDYIIQFLTEKGSDKSFVFTGGAIAHVIDSIRKYKEKMSYYCVQNEQVGAMAAEAYSRTTKKIGVQMVTSGPGATNMITGIAGAWYDCIPAIFLSGQVRTWELKGSKKLLQKGFQELDIVSAVKSITKYAVVITKAEDIRYEFEKAYFYALEGRQGPVLIDIPMNIQWADIEPEKLRSFNPPKKDSVNMRDIDMCKEMISKSSKPLIIVGGGIRQANAIPELDEFIRRTNIPVIFSYAGYDALPYQHPNHGGVMGQFGQQGANFATFNADLIIGLGTRFSIRQIGNEPDKFAPNAKIINVNVDEGELVDGRKKATHVVNCDLKEFFQNLLDFDFKSDIKWRNYVVNLKLQSPILLEKYKDEELVNPYVFMDKLSTCISNNAIIIPDIGIHVIVACQILKLKENQRLFSSWSNSPMGYSLPAAIGAQLGDIERDVICLIGDGGLQVNLQDLQTIVHYNLPIKIFLWNNHAYTTIMDFQDGNLEKRYEATDLEHGYSHPDFSKIATAYDIPYFSISSNDELTKIKQVLDVKGPAFCELSMDANFRAFPRQNSDDQFHSISPKQDFPLFK